MSETLDAKRAWLAEVLGVGEPEAAAPDAGPAAKQQKKGGLAAVGEALQTAANFVSEIFSGPELSAVQEKLNAGIDGLEALGLDARQLKLDRAEQESAIKAAEKIGDESKRKAAIARAHKRLAQLRDHARMLAKAAAKVMGKDKGQPSAEQKSAIYKAALEDGYGLKIKVPEGMENTHFDRVFDMLGTVPRQHTKHRKLKKLTYENDPDYGGAYGGAEVVMGDFGKADGAEDYEIDGKTVAANSFDVTTLHEMGHALDDAKKIMDKHGARSGAGGWKRENPSSVADAMLAHFKRLHGAACKAVTPDAARQAIETRLAGGDPGQPDGVADNHWDTLLDYLSNFVDPSRGARSPWFKSDAVDIDGRSYVESYANDWWSYEHAARAGTRVNNYQWRSPAEWFAEVYAITWLSRKKPPSAVDAAVAAYMWQG